MSSPEPSSCHRCRTRWPEWAWRAHNSGSTPTTLRMSSGTTSRSDPVVLFVMRTVQGVQKSAYRWELPMRLSWSVPSNLEPAAAKQFCMPPPSPATSFHMQYRKKILYFSTKRKVVIYHLPPRALCALLISRSLIWLPYYCLWKGTHYANLHSSVSVPVSTLFSKIFIPYSLSLLYPPHLTQSNNTINITVFRIFITYSVMCQFLRNA